MGRHDSADPWGAAPGDLGVGVWAGVAVRQVGLFLARPGGPGSPALGPGREGPQLHTPVDPQPHPALPPTGRGFWTGVGSPQPLILPNGLQRLLQTEFLGAPPLRQPHHHSGTLLGGLRSLHVASAAPGPRTPACLLWDGTVYTCHAQGPEPGAGDAEVGRPHPVCWEWPRAACPPPRCPCTCVLSAPALSSPFPPWRSVLCSVGA